MLLNSMKVVSFCHVLQGPACTQYLGDMGAQVIKVEPLAGERSRSWAGGTNEMSPLSGLYVSAFRNKRLISVDLKSDEGRELVLSLIDEADVVVENYRDGVMQRLGLSYEILKERKPDIIYASGSGWGYSGPMLGTKSQDLLIQGRTGMMSATGTELGKSKPVGSAIIDQHAGALLAMGIVSAYVKKLTTGEGTRVLSSLFAAGFDLQTEPLTVYMSTRPGADIVNRDPHLSSWYHHAPYGLYDCADREIVIIGNPISVLAEALDSDALRAIQDHHRYEKRDEIAKALADALRDRKYSDVAAAFDKHKVSYGPALNLEEVAEDPQAASAGIFNHVELAGRNVTLINHPIRYDGKTPELRVAGVKIGEHTREILAEHGYSEAQIQDFIDRKIVVAAT